MLSEVKNQVVDLLLEDVYTKHSDIRVKAKTLGCEDELDEMREKLITYLQSLR